MLHAALNRARFRWRSFTGAAAAVSLAAGAGVLLALFAGPAAGSKEAALASRAATEVLDATHLPPLLTLPGQRIVLRYDLACASSDAPTIH